MSHTGEALAVADQALRTGPPAWDVFAIRYGTRMTTRGDVYVEDAQPDAPLRMDYFFWVLRGEGGTILVDTGFDAAAGERRGRTTVIDPVTALRQLGIAGEEVHEIVLTHLHYDHTGNVRHFPDAEVTVQKRDLDFWRAVETGSELAVHVEPADMDEIDDRDGLTVLEGHMLITAGVGALLVGGHSPGQTALVVNGRERPVLLASDAVHYYEELERDRPFTTVVNLADMYTAFEQIREMEQDAGTRVIAGHDPLVTERFPAYRGTEGVLLLSGPAAPASAAPASTAPAGAPASAAPAGKVSKETESR
jgi:glyoxylase-like metal-dependent hydrolase (beta-lactamase superfamily II)